MFIINRSSSLLSSDTGLKMDSRKRMDNGKNSILVGVSEEDWKDQKRTGRIRPASLVRGGNEGRYRE